MKRKRLTIFIIPIALLIVYALVLLFVHSNERKMLYVPSEEIVSNVIDFNTEEIVITTSKGDDVSAIYNKIDDGYVILFSYGNAGNITSNALHKQLFEDLGYSYVMYDYPGYGKSTGRPTEDRLYSSATAVYDWLTNVKGYRSNQIVLMGQSLGGAVTVQLASEEPARAVIIESSFTSTHDYANEIMPWFPIRFFSKNKYKSIDKISLIKAPILITHGEADDIFSVDYADRLFEAVRSPKELYIVPEANHNSVITIGGSEYREVIRDTIVQ